jgi:thiol-disulfide isomerase/thioredoxin
MTGRTWFTLAIAATLAAISSAFIYLRQPTLSDKPQAESPRPEAAARIFSLVLRDVEGRPQRLEQWRGKILVVNYWATWCHPCKEEMPGFSRLQQQFQSKGVQFVGISIDDADKIIEFQKSTPVAYPLLIGDMDTMKQSANLGNQRQGLPFTAVFGRDGSLAMTKLGRWNDADLESKLAALIRP